MSTKRRTLGMVTPLRGYVTFFPHISIGLLTLALIWLGSALARADGPNQVGLVVVHGDGKVITKCIEFSEDKITGHDVLIRSGLDTNVDVSGGIGGAVCRIDSEGCTFPQSTCFCQCQQNTSCIFWSYWHLIGGDWQFSGLGAAGYQVGHGDVEGWVWGPGKIGSSASEPPDLKFDEICVPVPTRTATSTPTPLPATNTPTPTRTPPPTQTPRPTDTPKPVATPVIHNFTADRSTINAGQSVALNWNLAGADAAYLRYDGTEEGVIAPGSKSVSPTKTTTYVLVARSKGGEAITQLTITVNAAVTATPVLQPTAAPFLVEPAYTPPNTPSPSAAPQPTDAAGRTPTPTALPILLPTDTPLPAPAVFPTPGAEVVLMASPTPEAITQLADLNDQPSRRRFTTATGQQETGGSSRIRSFLVYGGVSLIVLLFLVLPVVLLAAGWIAWWLRRTG